MSDFLTAVSSTSIKRAKNSGPVIEEVQGSTTAPKNAVIQSPETALECLKNQPDPKMINDILTYLATESDKNEGFNLISPEPLSANIAYQLVNTTIPDYWRLFEYSSPQAKQIVRCLQNPGGLGAIISRLRPLIVDCRGKKTAGNTRDASEHIQDLLTVLERILGNDKTSTRVWHDVQMHGKNSIQKKLMWKEYVTQIASGRILSVAAEAEVALKSRSVSKIGRWPANGCKYAEWLGRNLATLMITSDKNDDFTSAVADLCGKALTLGYTDHIVSSMLLTLVKGDLINVLEDTMKKLKPFEQRKYLNAVLAYIRKQYFAFEVISKDDAPIQSSKSISGASKLVYDLIKDSDLLKDHLVSSLTKASIPALDDSLAVRRSVVAALTHDEEKMQNLLENGLKLFGDLVYIKHTPILQQEALAQTLALSSGYIQRSQPMFLMLMAKSTYHVNGVSNRIGASSPRARFLGIAVGTALSRMVDKPDFQLKFDLEGTEALEAKWYQLLTEVEDQLGKIEDLKTQIKKDQSSNQENRPAKLSTKSTTAPAITEIKGPRIVEVLSSEDEDDDLMAYEKPDSDPEDETDDPTTINRGKPTAPVYIRDLIAGLRDQENYDRHQLAISTAASLIRRKSNFGSEVADHIEELATVLTGLNDNLELEDFAQQRQRALIAVLLAKPASMAQWFARSFFSGDYSFTQRVAMLTTLGLGARELAGLKDESTSDLIPPESSFPSKQLPSHLHKIYSSDNSDPVSKITGKLARQMLSPMANQAADSLTGPSVLKVRHFSTRMEAEQRRSKPIPNALAQIVAENFFFPLTGHWWIQIRASSSSSHNDNIYTSTHLLPPLLHTLALLLHASGPNTLALPQMTREFWDLLLAVRTLALNDKAILEATLFALLMLLETNENKERLATEQGKELLETQEWVRMVFEGLGAGSEEDERVRVLAAGVVVRCQEVVEKYQRRLAGSMMDY